MDLAYIQGIATFVGIFMVSVLGLSLMTGFTGLFSFGHAAFMSIGAYTAATLMMRYNVPFYISLVAGGFASAGVSYFIGRVTLNLRGDYFCIATLGFGEAVRLIFNNITFFGDARGLPGIPRHTTLPIVVIINIIAITFLVGLIRSRHGRNMIAIREEELASRIVGIDVLKHRMTSFMIAAFYAGVAGGLWASHIGFLQPNMFNLVRSTELTIMVIFGGIGSITGSVLGTAILVSLPEIMRGAAEWRMVLYGVVVVFIIVFRPEGIMGGKEFNLKFLRALKGKVKEKKEV